MYYKFKKIVLLIINNLSLLILVFSNMKVTVIYNTQRKLFQDVELLKFEDFLQLISTTFNLAFGYVFFNFVKFKKKINFSTFDIFLGQNTVDLKKTDYLSDFGIISGDLLSVHICERSFTKTSDLPTDKY